MTPSQQRVNAHAMKGHVPTGMTVLMATCHTWWHVLVVLVYCPAITQLCLPFHLSCQGASDVIIVEGELDKLAVEEATGITAVLSMPAGAASPKCQPQQQRQQLALQDSSPGVRDVHNDKKFACVYRAQHLLAGCSRIIIALDGDEPGFYTACGLAQRLGPERCLYLPWPAAAVWGTDALQHVAAVARQQYGIVVDIAAGAGCKDANDVLMVYGREFLQSYLEQAPCLFADLLAAGVTG